MNFDWDSKKAPRNLAKHGVTFEEARLVFDDDFALVEIDDAHSFEERRYRIIGAAYERLLTVSYTERRDENGDELIWLISASEAEPYERDKYYEG